MCPGQAARSILKSYSCHAVLGFHSLDLLMWVAIGRPDLATAGATQAETTMTEDDDEEGLDGAPLTWHAMALISSVI